MSPNLTKLWAKRAPPCATRSFPACCLRRVTSSTRSPLATIALAQLAALGDGLGEAAHPSAPLARIASLSAVVVRSSPWRNEPFLENTTFGISFIGAASSSVDVGQYAAMS